MWQRQFVFTLYIYTILAFLFCVSAHAYEFSGTYSARIQTLPAYAIASVAHLLNSTICRKELQNFRDAVDQQIPWSLKVLDSSGEFKPGFLYGNNYWLGSRSQCFDTMNAAPLQMFEGKILNNILNHDPQQEFPPFEINYLVAHFKHNSTFKYHVNLFNDDVITIGLCLPASCTINDLIFILEKIFHDKVILIDDLYSTDFRLIQVKDFKNDYEWLSSGGLLFVCMALAFSFFMTTIGTIYDIFVYQKYAKKNTTNKINSNVEHIFKDIETEVNLSSYPESKIGKILICFSIYTNTRKILSMKSDASAISVIHGLRFLNMCFLVIGHTIYFTMDTFDNKLWLWRCIDNVSEYILSSVTIAVDFYFFSSGCLVTYLYLRDKTIKRQFKSIDNFREKLIFLFIHIIKRFIRLTPAYMIVLGLSHLSSAWFDKNSQFYMHERWHETCAKYWWRNLLYINNFFGYNEMCMNWSWYIANDMQFYIIAKILLILSTTHFYATVMILGALLIGSITVNAYIFYIYEFTLYPTFETYNKYLDIFYLPPWVRISPYIIGIITGYILTKVKVNNHFVLKRGTIILGWCFASVYGVFILFICYKQYISVLNTAIFISLHRICWAIVIGWVVIVCSTKQGGIVNQFLSFKGWIPLSKLSYCAYLLNPLIIRSICLYSEGSIHYEFLPLIITSMGYIVISYACSYVLSLTVEIPYNLLMRIFTPHRNINTYKLHDKKES